MCQEPESKGYDESDPSKGQLNECHNSLRLIKTLVTVNKDLCDLKKKNVPKPQRVEQKCVQSPSASRLAPPLLRDRYFLSVHSSREWET